MGKNFKKAAEDTAPVYSSIIGAAQEGRTVTVPVTQEEHEPITVKLPDAPTQEVQEADPEQKALDALKTQGRRGERLDRINMAFTPENYDYIRTMSKMKGQTMTQFVNTLVAVERDRNGAAYDAAKAILESL